MESRLKIVLLAFLFSLFSYFSSASIVSATVHTARSTAQCEALIEFIDCSANTLECSNRDTILTQCRDTVPGDGSVGTTNEYVFDDVNQIGFPRDIEDDPIDELPIPDTGVEGITNMQKTDTECNLRWGADGQARFSTDEFKGDACRACVPPEPQNARPSWYRMSRNQWICAPAPKEIINETQCSEAGEFESFCAGCARLGGTYSNYETQVLPTCLNVSPEQLTQLREENNFGEIRLIFSYCDTNYRGIAACYECAKEGKRYDGAQCQDYDSSLKLATDPEKGIRGITCGIPEEDILGEESKEFTKCCAANLDSEDVQSQLIQSVPEYFCLPDALTRVGGGLFGVFKDYLIDPLIEPFKYLNNIAHFRIKNAAGNVVGFFLPDKVYKGVVSNPPDKLCLSQIPLTIAPMFIGILPINRLNNDRFNQTKETLICADGAERVDPSLDPADPNCRCKRVSFGENLCDRYIKNNVRNQLTEKGSVDTFPSSIAREYDACSNCANSGGMYTGIGCIQTGLAGFTSSLLTTGIGIAGGIAFLCILYASFMLQTSRGNPERIKKAREYLNSCLAGLLIIIFSIFILQLVGVEILQLPGFTSATP